MSNKSFRKGTLITEMSGYIQKSLKIDCEGLDEIIKCLWNPQVVGNANGLQAHLEEKKIIALLRITREELLRQSMLVEMDAPVNICGDIHGQYLDLLEIFRRVGDPSKTNYLFLGDYVDRGRQSLETICLLFAYKVKFPERFYLLRGNHEDSTMNKAYGFFDECKRRYSVKLWKSFIDVFKCLPIAGVVGKAIFCCHGGLSPGLTNLNQIRNISRPNEIPDCGVMCDLLWADPNSQNPNDDDWKPNVERGISYMFGKKVVEEFLKTFKLSLVCRAHEVVEQGFEFFADKRLVTVFSAPLYTGTFDNDAAVLSVDSNLKCYFHILKPVKKTCLI